MKNYLDLIAQLFETVLFPLLAILTTFIVRYVQTKINALKTDNDNALLDKYLTMLSDTITDCVIATNQTYVDSLKEQGKFDAEAQKIAFQMTKDAVLEILTDDAKVYLSNALGDLEEYITQKIESTVNTEK